MYAELLQVTEAKSNENLHNYILVCEPTKRLKNFTKKEFLQIRFKATKNVILYYVPGECTNFSNQVKVTQHSWIPVKIQTIHD